MSDEDGQLVHGAGVKVCIFKAKFKLMEMTVTRIHTFSFGKQFVLGVCADGMQFIPAHQVVDVLSGAIENAAGFRCTDDAVLHIMMQCL